MPNSKEDNNKVLEACYLCGKLCAPKGLKAHIRSHTNITIYDCSECGHRFSTKKLLQQHKITHSTHYLCEECNGKYKDTEHLKSHKCIPVMEQRECQYCGKFCAPKGLVPHIRSHKNHQIYKCEVCEEKFSSKKKLKQHKICHKLYLRCDDCYKIFKDSERLKTHPCIYGKEKNHFCESCGKGFFTKYDLKRHLIIHTDDKPYKCEICNKGFNQKSNRDSHFRTHNPENEENVKERKFVCEICFYAFAYKQHLKRHLQIHNNEKPYSCEICKKCFSQKSYLKLHAMIHTNEKPFQCDQCHRRYPCKWKLVQHQRRHEEPDIFCPYCPKGFYVPSEYDRHLLTHTKAKPYICDVCHKGFTTRFSLQTHYQCHGNRVKRKEKVSDNKIKKINKISIESEMNCDSPEKVVNCKTNVNKMDNESTANEINNEPSYDNLMNETVDDFEDSVQDNEEVAESDNFTSQVSLLEEENNSAALSDDESEYVEIEIPTNLLENEIQFLEAYDPENFMIQDFDEIGTSGAYVLQLDKKPSPCHICNRIFSGDTMLENHRNEFMQEGNYICCKCGKRCEAKEDMLSHQKTHEIPVNNKPFVTFIKLEQGL